MDVPSDERRGGIVPGGAPNTPRAHYDPSPHPQGYNQGGGEEPISAPGVAETKPGSMRNPHPTRVSKCGGSGALSKQTYGPLGPLPPQGSGGGGEGEQAGRATKGWRPITQRTGQRTGTGGGVAHTRHTHSAGVPEQLAHRSSDPKVLSPIPGLVEYSCHCNLLKG